MISPRLNTLVSIWGTVLVVIWCDFTQTVIAHKDASNDYNLTESEYLALEGGSLLPLPDVTAKVATELQQIRNRFPYVSDIQHNRKWIPGQILSTRISSEQIKSLNESSYGPLKNIERIDVMPFFYVTVITFDKPYSPPVLSQKLETELGIAATPNTVYYEYEVDNIGYRMTNSTYIFKKGTGMCKQNCPDRQLWEFMVDKDEVSLVMEWSVPQNGERVVIN